jgi:hypothetical protein
VSASLVVLAFALSSPPYSSLTNTESSSESGTLSSPPYSSLTNTESSSESGTLSTLSYVCTLEVAPEVGLRFMSDNGSNNNPNSSSVSNLSVNIFRLQVTEGCTPPGPRPLGVLQTDSRGLIGLCCIADIFYMSLNYSGVNLSFNLTTAADPVNPQQTFAECVTLYLPSLKENVTYVPGYYSKSCP